MPALPPTKCKGLSVLLCACENEVEVCLTQNVCSASACNGICSSSLHTQIACSVSVAAPPPCHNLDVKSHSSRLQELDERHGDMRVRWVCLWFCSTVRGCCLGWLLCQMLSERCCIAYRAKSLPQDTATAAARDFRSKTGAASNIDTLLALWSPLRTSGNASLRVTGSSCNLTYPLTAGIFAPHFGHAIAVTGRPLAPRPHCPLKHMIDGPSVQQLCRLRGYPMHHPPELQPIATPPIVRLLLRAHTVRECCPTHPDYGATAVSQGVRTEPHVQLPGTARGSHFALPIATHANVRFLRPGKWSKRTRDSPACAATAAPPSGPLPPLPRKSLIHQ